MVSMPKPNAQYEDRLRQYASPMPVNIDDVSLRAESFDQILQNRGIRFIHEKVIPCPNISSLEDNTHNPNCTFCDVNGMYTYDRKEVYGIFTSNSLQKSFERQGYWEIGNAVVTVPSLYDDGTVCELSMFDKLVIPDFTVRLFEMQTYNAGIVSARYPINAFDYMASVEDDVLVTYTQNTDFSITNGKIVWIGTGKNPSGVFNLAYYANPVYVVVNQMRELRVSQQLVGGDKIATRMPSQYLVKRDYMQNTVQVEV